MLRQCLLISLCVIFIWPAACTLKSVGTAQKSDIEIMVDKLVQYEKDLEIASQEISKIKRSHDQCLQKVDQLEADYRVCAEGLYITENQTDIQNLHKRYQELKKINENLSNKINSLKIEIKKRDSIIEIQDDVIRVLDDTKKTIETNLKEQIAKKLFEIETTKDRLRMVIQDTILFDAGSMEINAKGKKVLQKIVGSVKENPDQCIRVEGHSDNNLPKNTQTSNWELSAARAIAVIHFLEAAGLDPSKLSVVAYGANRPVASNDTISGRLQNRRIELVLYYAN